MFTQICRGLLLMGLVSVVVPLRAEENPAELDADQLIADCWEKSDYLRSSPVTADMVTGMRLTMDCLVEVIVDQSLAFNAEGRFMSPEQVRTRLNEIGRLTEDFYDEVYNHHPPCTYTCGTMSLPLVASSFSRALEEMIRTMISIRQSDDF